MKASVDEEIQQEYYSTWVHGAVQVFLGTSNYSTIEEISSKLVLSEEMVKKSINFLKDAKLIELKAGTYRNLQTSLHLSKSSPLIKSHFSNWRLKTISRLDDIKDSDLLYSGVVSLSKEDFDRVRSILSDSLKSSMKICLLYTSPSPRDS